MLWGGVALLWSVAMLWGSVALLWSVVAKMDMVQKTYKNVFRIFR